MLTLTTYEHSALVVAAPVGHGACAAPAVATSGVRAMCHAAAPFFRIVDRRTEPAPFGTWKRLRRLVGFVT